MNNAKEKAKELVVKFHYQICSDNDIDVSDSTLFCAKQCAIIAVKEIMDIKAVYYDEKLFDFWNDTLKEIKNYEN